jgi:nicotinate-nucleotide pyrophosphorylase (carboxylating)
MSIDNRSLEDMVRRALAEDNVEGDATVALLDLGTTTASADIVVGGDAVVAGVDCARTAFGMVDGAVAFEARAADGTRAIEGDVVARVEGPAASILRAERVALNFLQRLTGIATMTSHFVARVAGTPIKILDTRKTTPLWRDLEKHAVRCGGGLNHRRDLGAMVLVKENHIRALGGPRALIERLRDSHRSGERPFVEVEVDSIEFLEQVLGAPIDRVMLDNFSPDGVRDAVERINRFRRSNPGARLEVEVSGGITLETIDAYCQPGVDFVSVGALTHSAPAVPLSLEVR